MRSAIFVYSTKYQIRKSIVTLLEMVLLMQETNSSLYRVLVKLHVILDSRVSILYSQRRYLLASSHYSQFKNNLVSDIHAIRCHLGR